MKSLASAAMREPNRCVVGSPYTAAGSVITEDVPAGALGIGRAKQTNILGWVLKKRKGSKSADAATKKEGSK